MPDRPFIVRNVYAARDLELFLVTAVGTILIVRAALAATGWPQLGGGKIHFAHLLWGGLGMLIALVLFMALQGRLWRTLAVLSAGIGFGLFIDELGKFITSDNDYFFQPAVAFIYLVFVVLFLVARALVGDARLSPAAALVNTFDVAKEGVMHELDVSERGEALRLLAQCDQSDPVVQDLAQTIRRMGARAKGPPRPYERLRSGLQHAYQRLLRTRWFTTVVIGWFVVVALAGLVYPFVTGARLDDLDFWESGQLVSSLAAGALVAIGILRWRSSRLAAYRWFARSLLVTIFVYEFFAFYQNQLSAVFGVLIVLVTYATVRLMIAEEETRGQATPAGAGAAAG